MIRKEIVPDPSIENIGKAPLSNVTVYFEEHGHDLVESEIRARSYIQYLADVIKDDSNYIDHGGAARVYTLGSEGGCVKVMKNRHNMKTHFTYNLGVTPLDEFKIMERVYGLEKSGCRAPVAEMCLDGGSAAVIVMEQLPAVNLQHVLNGSKELPEGFDYDEFAKSLEDYIDAMHKERGVVHADLYPRNVMIDDETGLPYVIDFGRSITLDGFSDEERRRHSELDWVRYDELFSELEKLRKSEKPKIKTIPLGNEEYSFDKEVHVHYSNHLLKEVFERVDENPLSGDEELIIKFGKNQNLVVSKNKNNIRGAFLLEIKGVTYYIGRKSKNYLV